MVQVAGVSMTVTVAAAVSLVGALEFRRRCRGHKRPVVRKPPSAQSAVADLLPPKPTFCPVGRLWRRASKERLTGTDGPPSRSQSWDKLPVGTEDEDDSTFGAKYTVFSGGTAFNSVTTALAKVTSNVCHVMPIHDMPCHVMSHHPMTCHAMS